MCAVLRVTACGTCILPGACRAFDIHPDIQERRSIGVPHDAEVVDIGGIPRIRLCVFAEEDRVGSPVLHFGDTGSLVIFMYEGAKLVCVDLVPFVVSLDPASIVVAAICSVGESRLNFLFSRLDRAMRKERVG